MTVRKYSSISQDTTLATSINAAATSLTVAAGTGASLLGGITLSAGDIFTIAIDVDTINEEIMYVTARTGDVLTVTRAQAGSSATTHSSGATIQHVLSSSDLNWFNNMIQSNSAIGTTPTLDGNSNQVQVRRATAATWTSTNPTLAAGEIGFETDTNKFKIGTGSAVWTALSYGAGSVSSITAGTGLSGGTITTSGTIAIDSTVATLTGTQTLTNKTLTDPVVTESVNAQTGTTYTPVLADAAKMITLSNASAITVTLPPASSVAYAAGSKIDFIQKGAGQVTFAQGSGVTIRSVGATATAPKLRAQYSAATAWYEGSDVWYIVGDIS